MDDELFRIVVTCFILIPMAISDWRERTVSTELLWSGFGISATFFVYDIMIGGFFNYYSVEIQISKIVGLVVSGAFFAMSRTGMMGTADPVVMASIVMITPPLAGIDTGAIIIFVCCVSWAFFAVASNAAKNIGDMLRKKRFADDIILSHIKRPGEKFTLDTTNVRVGDVKDGRVTSRNSDEEDLFVAEDAAGMRVYSSMPMVTFLFVSLCAVAATIFLTNVDMEYLLNAFEGNYGQILYDPGF